MKSIILKQQEHVFVQLLGRVFLVVNGYVLGRVFNGDVFFLEKNGRFESHIESTRIPWAKMAKNPMENPRSWA